MEIFFQRGLANFFFSHVVPVVNSKAWSHETSCLYYIPITHHLHY